jgi:cytochrome c biogenesis protein CcmG/thiol:disulfide interchange protein DsbE
MTAESPSEVAPDASSDRRRRTLVAAIPVLVFLVLAGFFAVGLTLDPSRIPSQLIGKPAPQFDLPAIPGRPPGLSRADLEGEVSLVNVFASWCAACRDEHPYWMELARNNVVPLHGLNYKDETQDALGWLNELGDPYDRVGQDADGRAAIEWGVYGVPETFVIDKTGTVVHKHVGPIDRKVLYETLLPMVRRLQAQG